ncbi:hypothetical protein PBCVNW6652_305R [Paramecium bursaria Chlorella virus NW665.2]|nr:hypothetical protein PBCVNW6652_305R [Paramecium bursaria Chlorella virus NW665.2]
MSFSKVLLALAFATVASARVLKSAPAPVKFINDCGLMTNVYIFNDKCESMRKEMRAREVMVDLWDSVAPQYFEFEDKVFDASGSEVSSTDLCGKKLYPVTDGVYLCKVDYAAEDDEASVDPPALSPQPEDDIPTTESASPAPSPSSEGLVVVVNNCQEDVMIGNFFKSQSASTSYDVRCAPYATIKHGESIYLDVSIDSSEVTYFSAYGLASQEIVPVSSATDAIVGTRGNYLARMVDPAKEHVECDNQLLGNDFYYAYSSASATIALC